MKKNRDLEYYISLSLILGLGLLFVFLAAPNKVLQLALVLLTTLFYIVFGVIHHMVNHDISIAVMLEYVIIGALGLSLIFLTAFGGLFL